MNVKKALSAQEGNIENAALEFSNAGLRHSSIFIEFQKEAEKYLCAKPDEETTVDQQVRQIPSPSNSP